MTPDKLQELFEAALMEADPVPPTRMVVLPRNPNGAESSAGIANAIERPVVSMDARSEMLARVNRIKEFLPHV